MAIYDIIRRVQRFRYKRYLSDENDHTRPSVNSRVIQILSSRSRAGDFDFGSKYFGGPLASDGALSRRFAVWGGGASEDISNLQNIRGIKI